MPKTPIYNYFNQKDMNLLISLCQEYGSKYSYQKNEEIQCFGDNPTNISIVISGIIKYSYIDDDGNEFVEEFKTSGQLFGDFPANKDRVRHPILITACSRVEIRRVSIRALFDILPPEKITEAQEAISRIIDEIHIYYMDQAQERSIIPAQIRYQQLKEQEPEVVRHAPAKDIASYLRISTEQLRRIKLKDNIN